MAHPNIVSVSSIFAQSIGFNLSSTATTTLFTVGDDRVIKVNTIMVANVDGTNAATVDLFVTKAQVDTEDDALVGAFTTNIDITGSFYSGVAGTGTQTVKTSVYQEESYSYSQEDLNSYSPSIVSFKNSLAANDIYEIYCRNDFFKHRR